MEPTICTKRLRLTLISSAERGSQESEWLHKLHSDEKTTWWSIRGRSKTIEDTERVAQGFLPTNATSEKTYRIAYAVHQILEPADDSPEVGPRPDRHESPMEFIGLIKLTSLDAGALPLPEHLTIPASAAATTLSTELAYMFLPKAWGRGYATESLQAVFEACKRASSFWTPYKQIYVRAIVNDANPASLRVMSKIGMIEKGVYEWTGKAIFLAGEWRERDSLHIFGRHLSCE